MRRPPTGFDETVVRPKARFKPPAGWKDVTPHDTGLLERTAYHEAGHCVAALQFGIPIISVTIENDAGQLLRGHYRERADLALECIVTFCLAGPAAEELFCGPVADGSDRADYEMARHYLARQYDSLKVGAEVARLREAARRLVCTAWAQRRIPRIADALLRHGTLTGDEIGVMIAADA
jgi:hypothetical protein